MSDVAYLQYILIKHLTFIFYVYILLLNIAKFLFRIVLAFKNVFITN